MIEQIIEKVETTRNFNSFKNMVACDVLDILEELKEYKPLKAEDIEYILKNGDKVHNEEYYELIDRYCDSFLKDEEWRDEYEEYDCDFLSNNLRIYRISQVDGGEDMAIAVQLEDGTYTDYFGVHFENIGELFRLDSTKQCVHIEGNVCAELYAFTNESCYNVYVGEECIDGVFFSRTKEGLIKEMEDC